MQTTRSTLPMFSEINKNAFVSLFTAIDREGRFAWLIIREGNARIEMGAALKILKLSIFAKIISPSIYLLH